MGKIYSQSENVSNRINKSDDPSNIPVKPTGLGSNTFALKKPKGVKGGMRQTQAVNVNPFGANGISFIPRIQYQNVSIDNLRNGEFTAQQLFEILPDVNPDVSKALTNVNLMCNSGWDNSYVTCYKMDGQTIDEEAHQIIAQIADKINDSWGGINIFIDQMHTSIATQGGVGTELVLTKDLKDVQDFFVVNGWTIFFQRDENQNLVAYQQQVMNEVGTSPFRLLNTATFWYSPFQPKVDDPYGRMLFSPALNAIFNLWQVLDDFAQVVHNQAWGHMDVKVIEEAILKNAPENTEEEPNARETYIQSVIGAIQDGMNTLKPTDSFVHLDSIEVNLEGVIAKLPDIKTIVDILRAQVVTGLKQLPILMGMNDATTETHGTVQYQIYVEMIKSIQSVSANILEKMFTTALIIRGKQCIVQVEYPDIKSTDRLMDSQAEAQEILNETAKVDNGWETNDDASTQITGTDSVGERMKDQMTEQILKTKPDTAATSQKSGDPKEESDTQRFIKQNLEYIQEEKNFRVLSFTEKKKRSQTYKDRLIKILETDPNKDFSKLHFLYSPEGLKLEESTIIKVKRIFGNTETRLIKKIYKGNKRSDDHPLSYYTNLIKTYFSSDESNSLLDEYQGVLNDQTVEGYNFGGQKALDQISTNNVFNLHDDEIFKALDKRAEEVATKSFKTLQEKSVNAIEAIKAGVDQNYSVDQIARLLREEFSVLDAYKANQIADTELNHAMSLASFNVYTYNGVEFKSWSTSGGSRVCPICISNEGQGVIKMSESFSTGDAYPPAHPDCLKGDTFISAEGITKAYKRWFDGEIVTINIGMKDITLTPNHPVLSDKGWVRAGDLKIGDSIYKTIDWDSFSADPNNNKTKTTIEQIFNSLQMSNQMSTVRVKTSPEDFNGDGIVNTIVDIVFSNLKSHKPSSKNTNMKTDSLGNIRGRFTSQISLVKIENINISEFYGYVYNLETKDHYYFSNSIITHNCDCTIVPELSPDFNVKDVWNG